ncbi:MAG: ABC transporter ATP-binding protein [Peptoniphilaceae bacterium]|nr:ABC transporter ATP-binding protein [Peptoniphilaceae bacterium]
MEILKLEHVKKSYGQKEVLRDINLTLETPGIRAVIGPNGSGKTTLFNLIAHLLREDGGSIRVLGKPNSDPSIFKEASFLKDNRVLYPYLTGMDHLSFIQSVQQLLKARTNEVIEKMQIGSYVHRRVHTYSLGMKQNLLIAMAMMNRPKLMILDEPLNGLDPTNVMKVRLLLQEMVSEGCAILISSHTLSEVDRMTQEIFFLKDGYLITEQGETEKNRKAEDRYMAMFPEEMAQVDALKTSLSKRK